MKNEYTKKVEELEAEGLTTSDAQGVADLHFRQAAALDLYNMLDKINTAFYIRTSNKKWIELMSLTKPLLQKARGE